MVEANNNKEVDIKTVPTVKIKKLGIAGIIAAPNTPVIAIIAMNVTIPAIMLPILPIAVSINSDTLTIDHENNNNEPVIKTVPTDNAINAPKLAVKK